MTGLSSRAFNRDLQSFEAGDQLTSRLDPAGDLQKDALGLKLNPNYLSRLSWKDAVKAVATASVTKSGTQTVDGVALADGDRVLLTAQSPSTTNGIYIVATGAWSRSTDSPTATSVAGVYVPVESGTANASSLWRQSADVSNDDLSPQAWSKVVFGGGYKTTNTISDRDTNFPIASQEEGFRVKVFSNNLVYANRDGAYIVEDWLTTVASVSIWNGLTDVVAGQRVFVDSLNAEYKWNGTSWEQVGCCAVGPEGTIIPGLVDSNTSIAISSAASFTASTGVFNFGSSSVPAAGQSLNLVRWTWTFSDPGFPNDGRVIVFEADTPSNSTSSISVASDTGGSPSARAATAQVTGDSSSWNLTANSTNDIVLSGGGSITVDLLVQDTGGGSNTAADIL